MAEPLGSANPAASQPAEGRGLDEIIALKKAKVAELRARGVNPYPSRSVRLHDAVQVRSMGASLSETVLKTEEKLSIAGRLTELRDMGKSIFGRLADQTGRAQVYFKKDALPEESFALIKRDSAVGDYLAVSGSVFRTKTGELTIAADSVTMLAKALRPLPEKWHGLTDTEVRYRHRHLDLISSPESREVFVK
ncbi:MAG TPA: OB-fold nucleic acid binding domain-containing protein, partial [Elusimicrobiota bacterium]|nr:OB-fold nucleic acid binding domain-containing protein [Elusimicrobiota bacterium]